MTAPDPVALHAEVTGLLDNLQRHRDAHEREGSTYAIYFPPECPWDLMEQLMDRIAEEMMAIKSCDISVFGQSGDCALTVVDESS